METLIILGGLLFSILLGFRTMDGLDHLIESHFHPFWDAETEARQTGYELNKDVTDSSNSHL